VSKAKQNSLVTVRFRLPLAAQIEKDQGSSLVFFNFAWVIERAFVLDYELQRNNLANIYMVFELTLQY
jgi:hypothetical protein